MLRLLADENVNGDILRGLRLHRPSLDVLRAQDVGLRRADDPSVLAWAAENGRIVVTHDRATMPKYAHERVAARLPMSGMFVVSDRLPTGSVIEEITLLDECSDTAEWGDVVAFLPL